MPRSRVLRVVALGLALGVGILGPAPAGADDSALLPQTLHFTSEPPAEAFVLWRYGYVVTAESTSGLPVVLSADPNTPACQVVQSPPSIYGNVFTDKAGPCTVFADQPGNDEYAPAERISMTFEVSREPSMLQAKKASKGLLGLTPTTFSANLLVVSWWGPSQGWLPDSGQVVTFSVGGKQMCSAKTVYVDDGSFFGSAIATCKATIGLLTARRSTSYTAEFAGDDYFLPSTAQGVLQ